ncbi:MAG: oligosaccharide flippase family protein [Oscillospiraceae bacterium]|nr:oligosaccharide flippase family protein [Oscillospiraceae bacterium]
MKDNTLKRNLLFNTVGNGIYYLSQWVITGWLIQRLSGSSGTYNAGLLSTAATVANMFLGLAGFGMRNFQVSDNTGDYSDTAYEVSRYFTVCLSVVLSIGYSLITGYRGVQFWCILFFLLYKMTEPMTDVWHGILQKAERMDVIGIAYGMRGILSVLFFALGMLVTKNLIVSLILLVAVAFVTSYFYDLRKTNEIYQRGSANPKIIASLLIQCLPLAIHTFLNGVSTNLPKIYLERILGTEQMGVYNLVNSPVLILQVGIAYLFAPFITHFTRRMEEKDKKGFLHLAGVVFGIIVAAGLLGLLGCAIFGKWGLEFLYHDSKVTAESGQLYPMVICVVFSCFSVLLCMLNTILRSMAGLLISNVAEIIIAVAVSAPLIRKLGLAGATLATIITLLVQCILLVGFGLRSLNKHTEDKEKESDGE